MKYRLKDRALQKQLDAISNGDFSEKLNTEAQKMFSPVLAREVFRVYFGYFDALANRFSVLFELDEIEEAPEYDPTRWNLWPNVEPPEDVGMQIEIVQLDPSGKPLKLPRFCGYSTFRNNYWYNIGHVDNDEIVRFRPWDRPEENKE